MTCAALLVVFSALTYTQNEDNHFVNTIPTDVIYKVLVAVGLLHQLFPGL